MVSADKPSISSVDLATRGSGTPKAVEVFRTTRVKVRLPSITRRLANMSVADSAVYALTGEVEPTGSETDLLYESAN